MEEQFKPIPGFENYHVSPSGKIKNSLRGNTMSVSSCAENPYWMVTFMLPGRKVRKKYVHRIVMETWSPNPDPSKYDSVGFKDKNPDNYSVDNLYWTNQKELMALRKQQDRYQVGENHHMTKLTWDDIQYIRESYAQGIRNQCQLAKEYNVLPCTIGSIVHNKSWKTK